MRITRFDEAREYDAPKHFRCTALRLQGGEASGAEGFSVGLSTFQPGGGCERGASALAKVYVVLEGEVTVITDDGERTLYPYDSCYVAPDEARSIENRTDRDASMLVVLPCRPPQAS